MDDGRCLAPSKRMHSLARRLLFAGGVWVLSGCGGGETKVTLRFENELASSSQQPLRIGVTRQGLEARTPTRFEMKLISVYLTEDIDPATQNNRGHTAMIYLNPTCADDIMHCSVAPGTAEDGLPFKHVITDFFNFSADSRQVNAALNAQARGVEPGNYRYARVEFCKYGAGQEPNIRWAADGVPTRGFVANTCAVTSAPMDPPLHLEVGESVAITLNYNLASAVTENGNNGGSDCLNTGAGQTCFTLPTFVPSATRLP